METSSCWQVRLVGLPDPAAVRRILDQVDPRLVGFPAPRAVVLVGHSRPNGGEGETVLRRGPFAWIWLDEATLLSNRLPWVLAHELAHVLIAGRSDWKITSDPWGLLADEYIAERIAVMLLPDSLAATTIGYSNANAAYVVGLSDHLKRKEARIAAGFGTDDDQRRLANGELLLARYYAYAKGRADAVGDAEAARHSAAIPNAHPGLATLHCLNAPLGASIDALLAAHAPMTDAIGASRKPERRGLEATA